MRISQICSNIHIGTQAAEASVTLAGNFCLEHLSLVSVNIVDRVLKSEKATTYNLNLCPWFVKFFKGTLNPFTLSIMNVSLIEGVFPKPLKKISDFYSWYL